jgi:hypothetical protein
LFALVLPPSLSVQWNGQRSGLKDTKGLFCFGLWFN